MDIDYDKIRNLLQRVNSGNAGEVYINFNHERKTCTITWKRPRGVLGHESYKSRAGMLLYVKDLLADAGVWVNIIMEVTREEFLPEDC